MLCILILCVILLLVSRTYCQSTTAAPESTSTATSATTGSNWISTAADTSGAPSAIETTASVTTMMKQTAASSSTATVTRTSTTATTAIRKTVETSTYDASYTTLLAPDVSVTYLASNSFTNISGNSSAPYVIAYDAMCTPVQPATALVTLDPTSSMLRNCENVNFDFFYRDRALCAQLQRHSAAMCRCSS
jgi:cytoskeletal protein RodZ